MLSFYNNLMVVALRKPFWNKGCSHLWPNLPLPFKGHRLIQVGFDSDILNTCYEVLSMCYSGTCTLWMVVNYIVLLACLYALPAYNIFPWLFVDLCVKCSHIFVIDIVMS